MIQFLANIVAIAILGILVLLRGRDRQAGRSRSAHWLRIAAFIPLGFPLALFLLFGIGEMAGGELGGAMHLLGAIVIALLGIFAWMRPIEGGIALFLCGALSRIGLIIDLVSSGPLKEGAVISSSFFLTAVPQIVSGALFFIAGVLARRATIPNWR